MTLDESVAQGFYCLEVDNDENVGASGFMVLKMAAKRAGSVESRTKE